MRIFRLVAATLFLAAIAAVPAFAQTRTGAAQPAAAPAQGGNTAIPASKIAFVNTLAFRDEKSGITRWIAAAKSLQREFEPREKELQTMQTRLQAIAKEIETLSSQSVVSRETITNKQDEGEKLQRELKFKEEEGKAAFQKRYNEVVGPISADIGKALDAFAKQRGITLVLDLARLAEMGAILSADNSTDVTAAFIAEYNSKNPATASTASPGR
jgi:outer membrane protein